MGYYEYKVVPFIGKVRSSESAAGVGKQLESVIASETQDYWELYQLADVNIEVAPGCLASLFGATASYVRFDQLIFRRYVE